MRELFADTVWLSQACFADLLSAMQCDGLLLKEHVPRTQGG